MSGDPVTAQSRGLPGAGARKNESKGSERRCGVPAFTVMRCSATLAPHARSRRGRAARADAAPAPDTGEERPREQAQRPGSGKADGDHDRRGP